MKIQITHDKKGNSKSRVSVTYDDLWNGEATLAQVIYPFLKKYRSLYNRKNPWTGYPADFAPDPLKPEGPDNPDRFNEWLECLDQMIYSFEWLAKRRDDDGPAAANFYKEYHAALKPHRKELKKLALEDKARFAAAQPNTALNSLGMDRRLEIMRPIVARYNDRFDAHRAKLQAGIDLFAKYYRSFWM